MVRVGVLALLTAMLTAQEASPLSPSDQAYAHAVDLLRAGQIAQARDDLAALLRQNPKCFFAYQAYWDTIARTKDDQARSIQAADDLRFFESVAKAERTEDFYRAFESALRLTGQQDRAELVRREELDRFPKGMAAQLEILDAARIEPDPAKSVAMFRDYIRRFPDNISWTESAAHGMFLKIMLHRDFFGPSDLMDAASLWEKHELVFIRKFGNPYQYYDCLKTVADAVLSTNPGMAVDYCHRGEAFVEAEWPETTEFSDEARRDFWPILLQAYSALKRWDAALRLGSVIEPALDSGAYMSAPSDAPAQAAARAAYGAALEATGSIDAARRQFGIAATLDPKRRPDLAHFEQRHPISGTALSAFEASWRGAAENIKAGREEAARKQVLASEESVPATPLRMRDAAGHPVSLAQFRGKPLILSFWATWCTFCYGELAELNEFESSGGTEAAILAVSVDVEKEKVAPFAAQRGYRFPIAISDGSGESAYGTSSIPQLYVLDAAGNIRFHLEGYPADGLFLDKLRWMVGAAASGAPVGERASHALP
jgi:thiol-disulfide isomerase/thioredoxin